MKHSKLMWVMAPWLLSGCSVLVDGALHDQDVGSDARASELDTPPSDAWVSTSVCTTAGVMNGEACTIDGLSGPRICNGGLCLASRCGDGIRDRQAGAAEECDDGNDVPSDGCEPDCTPTCAADTDCDDTNPCTTDTCSASSPRLCVNTEAAMNTPCPGGLCIAGAVCRPTACGDGTRTTGEACDDGNTTAGDGCEADCTPTCTMDTDCEDGAACNGIQTCGSADPTTGARRCAMTTPPVACTDSDGNACTLERCVDAMGCVTDTRTNDVDGDGYFRSGCGATPVDCNDANPAIHPGAAEICGNSVDDDCNSATVDSAQTTYYVDCDGDGYAASSTGSVRACMPPTTTPSTCRTGAWTTTQPNTGTTDCNDLNADARPRQTAYFGTPGATATRPYDYDCNGSESREYSTRSTHLACSTSGRDCVGSTYYFVANPPACGSETTLSSCSSFLGCARLTLPGGHRVRCR